MKHALDMVREVQARENKKKLEKEAREAREQRARKGNVELTFWQRWKFRGLKKEVADGVSHVYDYSGVLKFSFELRLSKFDDDYIFWHNYCAFYIEQFGYLDVRVEEDKIGDRYWGLRIRGSLPKSLAEQVLFGTKIK